jgi:hypothetical protein
MPKAKTPRNSRSKQVSSDSNLTVMSDGAAAAPSPAPVSETKSEVKKIAQPIPINLDEEIRRRAYEIFQQRGNAPGSEHDDWVAAEREVLARYQQQRA